MQHFKFVRFFDVMNKLINKQICKHFDWIIEKLVKILTSPYFRNFVIADIKAHFIKDKVVLLLIEYTQYHTVTYIIFP